MNINEFIIDGYKKEDMKLYSFMNESYDMETAKEASFRWKNIKKLEYDKGFIEHQFKDFLQRYGFNEKQNFIDFLENVSYIAEIGAGEGRLIDWYLKYSNAIIFAVEISDSVYYLNKKYKDESRVIIIKADINQKIFHDNTFDLISMEQSIHHLSNPKKAFKQLVSSLKQDGNILLSVYSKKSAIREKFDFLIRDTIAKLNSDQKYDIAKKITDIAKILSEIKVDITIPKEFTEFGDLANKTLSFQRFFYYSIFKCFWNDKYSNEKNIEINFDWYSYPVCNKISLNELVKWFVDLGLVVKYIYADESNINILGNKQ